MVNDRFADEFLRRRHIRRAPWQRRALRFLALLTGLTSTVLLIAWPERDPRSEVNFGMGSDVSGAFSAEVQPNHGDTISQSPQLLANTSTVTSWRMYFATNREVENESPTRLEFGDRARRLRFGIAFVEIPADHQRGIQEPTKGWLPWPFSKQQKGISIQSQRLVDEDIVLKSLANSLTRMKRPELLIVVHGYNVTHDEAVTRTCQVAHDLPYDGAVLAFTWPSTGRLDGYFRDENNASFSEAEFAELIGVLRRALPPTTRINILAHSMGNRVVLGGLNVLSDYPPTGKVPRIHHLILAAPDVGHIQFANQARHVSNIVDRLSLYTSIKDNALVLSHAIHGEARAGQLTSAILLLSKLETLDVSPVDESLLGHSYYGSSEAVLNDLFYLLNYDRRPEQSPWLVEHPGESHGHYWSFAHAPPRAVLMATKKEGTNAPTIQR